MRLRAHTLHKARDTYPSPYQQFKVIRRYRMRQVNAEGPCATSEVYRGTRSFI